MCSDSFENSTSLLKESSAFENSDSCLIAVSETRVSNQNLRKRGFSSFLLIQLFNFFFFHSDCSISLMSAAFHPAEHLDQGRSKDIALKAAPSTLACIIWVEIIHWHNTVAWEQLWGFIWREGDVLFNVWLKPCSSEAAALPGAGPGAARWPWCSLPQTLTEKKPNETNQKTNAKQKKHPKQQQKKYDSPMLLNFCGGGVTAVQFSVCSSDFPWFFIESCDWQCRQSAKFSVCLVCTLIPTTKSDFCFVWQKKTR